MACSHPKKVEEALATLQGWVGSSVAGQQSGRKQGAKNPAPSKVTFADNWSRAVTAQSTNKRAEIVCAKCGVQSFLRYQACRKCGHQSGFLFLPGHAPPQGPPMPWSQCQAHAQQQKHLQAVPATALPPPPPALPPLGLASPSLAAPAGDVSAKTSPPTWESMLMEATVPRIKEELARLQGLRSHLVDLQCSSSVAEVEQRINICKKALTKQQPEGQRLEQLKAALKRAQAAKDKAEAQFVQAQRTLEECRAKVDETCLNVLQATDELDAFRMEHREACETSMGCETQRNLVANTLAERISSMVAQARNNKEELSNTQVASAISVELLALLPQPPPGNGKKRAAEQQLGKEDEEHAENQDEEMKASQSVLTVPTVPPTVPDATTSQQNLPVPPEKEKQRAAPY